MKLKINNHEWVIKISPQSKMLEIAEAKDTGRYYFGLCNYPKQEIHLSECIHKDRLEHTIIHELCHAFIDVKNIARETECDFANFFAAEYDELLNKADDIYKWAKEELYGDV